MRNFVRIDLAISKKVVMKHLHNLLRLKEKMRRKGGRTTFQPFENIFSVIHFSSSVLFQILFQSIILLQYFIIAIRIYPLQIPSQMGFIFVCIDFFICAYPVPSIKKCYDLISIS